MPASIWPGEGFLLVSGLRSGGIVLDLGQIRWLGDVEFRLATPGAANDLRCQPGGKQSVSCYRTQQSLIAQMKNLGPVFLHGTSASQTGFVCADGLVGPFQTSLLLCLLDSFPVQKLLELIRIQSATGGQGSLRPFCGRKWG